MFEENSMKKAFEIQSMEKLSNNTYKIGGRALISLALKMKLNTADNKMVLIKDIIYYNSSIGIIDPPATCYLIVETSDELDINSKYFNG